MVQGSIDIGGVWFSGGVQQACSFWPKAYDLTGLGMSLLRDVQRNYKLHAQSTWHNSWQTCFCRPAWSQYPLNKEYTLSCRGLIIVIIIIVIIIIAIIMI